ncbi:hypothetical protein TNCV_3757931 [Trichonephila clavipes]|nr:hypothetical protein TNCV_3757931 [Trichonephila clavipes]
MRKVLPRPKKPREPCQSLATVDPGPGHLERAEAVARFCLAIGHVFLGVYHHWLVVAADEVCPLCGHDWMDVDSCFNQLDSMST